jgi:hypothetical protein
LSTFATKQVARVVAAYCVGEACCEEESPLIKTLFEEQARVVPQKLPEHYNELCGGV